MSASGFRRFRDTLSAIRMRLSCFLSGRYRTADGINIPERKVEYLSARV